MEGLVFRILGLGAVGLWGFRAVEFWALEL